MASMFDAPAFLLLLMPDIRIQALVITNPSLLSPLEVPSTPPESAKAVPKPCTSQKVPQGAPP
jgi:hypothetical protein